MISSGSETRAALTTKPTVQETTAKDVSASQEMDQRLARLEQKLLATRYNSQPESARLDRLENILFGAGHPNLSALKRVENLERLLFSKDSRVPMDSLQEFDRSVSQHKSVSQQKNKKNPTTISRQEPPDKKKADTQSGNLTAKPLPGETNYPVVSQMEHQQFGRSFEGEDITLRLDRLEAAVFKYKLSGSLADRVDHLQTALPYKPDQTISNGAVVEDPSGQFSYRTAGNSILAEPIYQQVSPVVLPSPNRPPLYQPRTLSRQPVNSRRHNTGKNSSQQNQIVFSYGPNGSRIWQNSQNSTIVAPPNYRTTPFSANSMPSNTTNSPNNSVIQYEQPVTPEAINPIASETDMLIAINSIESDLLGRSYSADPVDARLDRLEEKVFESTSPELSRKERMERIIAVASANGDSESGLQQQTTLQKILPFILTVLPMLLL
ncbi:MAG: hypothetical protein AAGI66_05915 [Cyanobacteria bacterium P01_H01_bin.74]